MPPGDSEKNKAIQFYNHYYPILQKSTGIFIFGIVRVEAESVKVTFPHHYVYQFPGAGSFGALKAYASAKKQIRLHNVGREWHTEVMLRVVDSLCII